MVVRWLVVALASVEAAYMVFDGVHAVTRGDYVTPTTGEYAGQLGPWAGIVAAVGVDPRSVPVKWLFVVYGVAWLAIVVAFVLGAAWAWWPMLAMAVGSLWYLVPGTVMSALIIVVLLLPPVRRAYW